MSRFVWKLAKVVGVVITVLFWVQSATTFPHWLVTVLSSSSNHHGPHVSHDTLVRILLVLAGLAVMLVVLGPERTKRWVSELHGSHSEVIPDPLTEMRRRLVDFARELQDDVLAPASSASAALRSYCYVKPRDSATYLRLGVDLLERARVPPIRLATGQDIRRAEYPQSVADVISLFREFETRRRRRPWNRDELPPPPPNWTMPAAVADDGLADALAAIAKDIRTLIKKRAVDRRSARETVIFDRGTTEIYEIDFQEDTLALFDRALALDLPGVSRSQRATYENPGELNANALLPRLLDELAAKVRVKTA